MRIVGLTAAVAALAVLTAPAAFSQEKPGAKMGMKHKPGMTTGKMAKTVYVCTQCKMYSSEADASRMTKDASTGKYMDAMGHKLVPMKKVPPGFKVAAMAKMHGRMEHKPGDKMHGKMKGKMHGKTKPGGGNG